MLCFSSYLFRSTMAWGLEARVPFLDKAFLEAAMNIDPKEKMFHKGGRQEVDEDGQPIMEKVWQTIYIPSSWGVLKISLVQYILRKAFDCSPDGKVLKSLFIPRSVSHCQ